MNGEWPAELHISMAPWGYINRAKRLQVQDNKVTYRCMAHRCRYSDTVDSRDILLLPSVLKRFQAHVEEMQRVPHDVSH